MAIRGQRRYTSLTKGKVKSGMMIQFNYTKTSGEGSRRGQYTVLVIDPDKKNKYTLEPQLHGFIIEDLSDDELVNFLDTIGTNTNLNSEDKRRAVVEELNTDEAYERFKSSGYVKERSYRTFNTRNMSRVRQILIGKTKEEKDSKKKEPTTTEESTTKKSDTEVQPVSNTSQPNQ
jgi:hypothetical protein